MDCNGHCNPLDNRIWLSIINKMMFDDEFSNVEELIKLCISVDRIDKKLQIVFNICQILEPIETTEKFKKDVTKISEFVQNLLMNNEFRKAVHKRIALMEREPIVYFGELTLKGDQYDYDKNLEEDITNIEFAITRFLGDVMKNIKGMQEL